MVILKSHAAHVFRCMGINIIPGINTIENDKILSHVSVKMRLANYSLELIEGTEPEVETPKKSNGKGKKTKAVAKRAPQPRKDPVDFFVNLDAHAAKKHIKEMFDVKFLEKYLTHESRQDIIDCIVKQIKFVKQDDEEGK